MSEYPQEGTIAVPITSIGIDDRTFNMPTQVVTYTLDDETVVKFEVDPIAGFTTASADQVVGPMQEAIEPVVAAARVVLDKIRQMRPDEVEVKFAVKVNGTMNWLIAKAATEGNFEVTMRWQSGSSEKDAH